MNDYTFPAIHGRQGLYDYYLIQCSLRLLNRLFLFNEAEVPADLRRLQTIDLLIVSRWVNYLSSNKDNYVLAPLVAVVDGMIIFESLITDVPEIGHIKIPMNARLIIQDGQHRRAAIKSLLSQDSTLSNDTIPIMLIPDNQLERAPDIYIDLHPIQTQLTRSKRVLHDHNDLATLVRQLVDEVPIFRGLIELEKTTISNRSTALFTLSAVYQATQALLDVNDIDRISSEDSNIVYQFWETIGNIIPEWRRIINRETTSSNLRQNYIHSHTVTLLAIGMAGHELIAAYPADWPERLKILGNIDWSRDNRSLWEGRAMVRGKMNKSRDSIKLTASVIKRLLGLKLTERELSLEKTLSGSQ